MKTLPTVLAALIATMLPNVLSAQQPDQPREIRRRLFSFRGQITLLQALDTDGDHEISADEMEKADIVLAKLDANKDGKLTIRELRIPYDVFTRAANVFERLDANDDGTLSSDEIPEGMQRLIKRGDTDDDGILTKEEFEDMLHQRVGFGTYLQMTNSLPIGRDRNEK